MKNLRHTLCTHCWSKFTPQKILWGKTVTGEQRYSKVSLRPTVVILKENNPWNTFHMASFALVFQGDFNSSLVHLSMFVLCKSVQCWGCQSCKNQIAFLTSILQTGDKKEREACWIHPLLPSLVLYSPWFSSSMNRASSCAASGHPLTFCERNSQFLWCCRHKIIPGFVPGLLALNLLQMIPPHGEGEHRQYTLGKAKLSWQETITPQSQIPKLGQEPPRWSGDEAPKTRCWIPAFKFVKQLLHFRYSEQQKKKKPNQIAYPKTSHVMHIHRKNTSLSGLYF